MASVDFGNAPPPTPIDGQLAVPMHITDLRAALTLDGATATAFADATMTYVVGPADGNPIFDLRQAVYRCWLDGTLIDPVRISSHDVGAGRFGTVRLIDVVQSSGSVHTLRVLYRLSTPHAELGGAYPPLLQWSAGPRLRWSFGMSDLSAGRYLESWIPSNLPFDQFPLTLDIRIVETRVAHALITNGTITAAETNSWSVCFPSWFTAMSPLLEIRAVDKVRMACAQAKLPISGKSVTIEAWKLAEGCANLPLVLAQIRAHLTDNEDRYGEYLGEKFTCFLHGVAGGMEYNQATTTSEDALDHEIFHSWFARGITPASQADGWWDEGFTTFNIDGADTTEPFDFREAPVELCSRQSFQRRTVANAYTAGSRFFRGVAATIGAHQLRLIMRYLFELRRGTPVSTVALEACLIARSGGVSLVDAFHRFVYGFAEPVPHPRIGFGNATAHHFTDPAIGGAYGHSPDLWVRHSDDGGLAHLAPECGIDNWLYARVRNDLAGGECRHFVVTFALQDISAGPVTYPQDFFPAVTAACGFDLLPGQTRILSALLPRSLVPARGSVRSLIASVHARGCHPPLGIHVWEQTTLAQRTLRVR